MSACPRCQAMVAPNLGACPRCGWSLVGANPGMPPAYGGTAPAPVPSTEGSGTGMKILGGCGVAGCLGAVLAIVAVLGLGFFVFLAGARRSPSPRAGSGALPGSGSLRDLVQPRVGGYTPYSTGKVTRLGSRLAPSVVDSLAAGYRTPGGGKLIQILLVYPSASIADKRMSAVVESLVAGLGKGQKLRMTDVVRDGRRVGRAAVVQKNGKQHVYWTNGKLLTFATALPPHAEQYQRASPY